MYQTTTRWQLTAAAVLPLTLLVAATGATGADFVAGGAPGTGSSPGYVNAAPAVLPHLNAVPTQLTPYTGGPMPVQQTGLVGYPATAGYYDYTGGSCPECQGACPGRRCLFAPHTCSRSPDYGWSVPGKYPIQRRGVQYNAYYPNAWWGQPGSGVDARGAATVYQPTDTTQLGFTYQHVPFWQPHPNPLPQRPDPAQWHNFAPTVGATSPGYPGTYGYSGLGAHLEAKFGVSRLGRNACSCPHCRARCQGSYCPSCQGHVHATYGTPVSTGCPNGNCHGGQVSPTPMGVTPTPTPVVPAAPSQPGQEEQTPIPYEPAAPAGSAGSGRSAALEFLPPDNGPVIVSAPLPPTNDEPLPVLHLMPPEQAAARSIDLPPPAMVMIESNVPATVVMPLPTAAEPTVASTQPATIIVEPQAIPVAQPAPTIGATPTPISVGEITPAVAKPASLATPVQPTSNTTIKSAAKRKRPASLW